MTNKVQLFQILLEQISAPKEWFEESVFQNAMIERVKVYRGNQHWQFFLNVEKILPFELFIKLRQLTAQAFAQIASIEFDITAKDDQYTAKEVEDYWNFAVHQADIHSPICNGDFKQKRAYVKDGKVYFDINHAITQEHFDKEFLPRIAQVYTQCGFPSHFQIISRVDQIEGQKEIEAFDQKRNAAHEKMQVSLSEISQKKERQKEGNSSTDTVQLGGKISDQAEIIQMDEILDEERKVIVEGYIFDVDVRTLRSERQILIFKMTDYTSSITCKKFSNNEQDEHIFDQIREGMWLRVEGSVQEDTFLNDLVIMASRVNEVDHQFRQDQMPEDQRRIELHTHTQMSQTDGTNSATEIVARAAEWGHPAVAITDHGNVYAFPEAYAASKQYQIPIIYGMEAYLVDDGEPVAYDLRDIELSEATYVIFDVETTGLSAIYDQIIELAGVKMYKGNVIEEFQEFIDPGRRLSDFTTQLTGITDDMLAGSKSVEEVLQLFADFTQDTILVAHNAPFDMGFLNRHYEKYHIDHDQCPVIDTLAFSRFLHPHFNSHRLNTLAKRYDISLEQHHRAIYDAETTGHLLYRFLKEAREDYQVTNLSQLNDYVGQGDSYKQTRPVHATLLVKSQAGLKNLFKLVSLSHVDYFYRVPRIPKSIFKKYREGLLVGSACSEGEIFTAVAQKGMDEARNVAKLYDYFEVMPKSSYRHLLADGTIGSQKDLEDILKNIVSLGEELGKPVVATGNVHYLDEHDGIYREIILSTINQNADRDIVYPHVHFRTTEEMLNDFHFLGEEKAHEIVIDNTHLVFSWIDEGITPIKDKLYPPKISGAEEEVREITYAEAHRRYGEALNQLVSDRIEKELKSIIGNGFSVIYLIAQKLVKKSNDDGYIVGSRGSVGSSFVAHLMGITEVNPLVPHYLCPNCHWQKFYEDGSIGSGFDLPNKQCPICGHDLRVDGHDIPFETFLGFNGEKVPDIDLNFSGEYQAQAHEYTKVLFGEDHVYRAGTISTIADRTAFGYVKGYERDKQLHYRKAEIDRLTKGVAGARRTTGQHPGGIIVIPDDMDVYDFTPVQYPANDQSADWKTTHFDFHSIEDNVLKLDILGHDDPTMIKKLQDLSGINPQDIPLNDPDVMKLFSGTEVLGVTPEQIYSKLGTLGVPEFGTNFVRGMLKKTKPSTFSELLQISGLSHGTDVWLGNAEVLIDEYGLTLADVIGCRDDIMVDLQHKGLTDIDAFRIMESVRKGRGLTPEWIEVMREHGVEEWYIQSCLKIKYMFPKAHAAAYIINALRVAYFKVHYPLYYYAAYFSVRANDFNLEAMVSGKEAVKKCIEAIYAKGNEATAKENSLLVVLEIANEMLERNFSFEMVDIDRSDATDFVVKDEYTLLAPFRAVPSLGASVARSIIVAREEDKFLSKEDLSKRGKVSKKVMEYFERNNVISHLPDENQLSLF